MDLARGIPHVTGLPEHDRLALLSLPDRPIGPSEAIVLESLDPAAFAQAIRLAGVIRPGPGVAVLPGPDGAPPRSAGGSSAAGAGPGEGPIAPWAPVWLALGLVVLFALVGAPWAHLPLRHDSRLVRLGLAPALGLASVGLASILVDSVGLRLGTPVGAGVAIVGGFALGVAAVVARSRLLPGAAVLSG